ncbi:Bcr/CflA family drug resistance efflux transporter, partial [Vibrio campbellii]
ALQMIGAFGFTYGLSMLPATQSMMVLTSWMLAMTSAIAFFIIFIQQRRAVGQTYTLSEN